MMDVIGPVAALVGQAIQMPVMQGLLVAAATQAVKQAPVGPSGGPAIRGVAAALAIAAAVAGAMAKGDTASLDPAWIGSQLLEALTCFAAATGIWASLKQE
jgi:hypothetical protein